MLREVRIRDKCFSVPVASGFLQRLTGLMFKKDFLGMYFPRCNAVHTFFMSCSIDVVFFDKSGRSIRIFENVPPNRVVMVKNANSVLELKGGLLNG